MPNNKSGQTKHVQICSTNQDDTRNRGKMKVKRGNKGAQEMRNKNRQADQEQGTKGEKKDKDWK